MSLPNSKPNLSNCSGGGGVEKDATTFVWKYCRMCGVQLKQGVFIFGDEGKRLQIPEKIRKTLAILVLEEDTLPKKICTRCCSSLEDYSQYKDTVLDAQEKLSAIVKNLEQRSQYEKSQRPQHQPSILQQALTSATIFSDTEAITDNGVDDDNDFGDGDDQGTTTEANEELGPSMNKCYSPNKPKTLISTEGENERPFHTSAKNSVSKDGSTLSLQESNNAEDWVLQCGVCGIPTSSRMELKTHHEQSHGDKYPLPVYGCTFCPRISENYNALRLHIYRHLKEGSYKCEHCERTFPLKNQLERHSNSGVTGKTYSCKICGRQQFTAKCSLVSHMKSKHPDAREPQGQIQGSEGVCSTEPNGVGQNDEHSVEMEDHSEALSPVLRSSSTPSLVEAEHSQELPFEANDNLPSSRNSVIDSIEIVPPKSSVPQLSESPTKVGDTESQSAGLTSTTPVSKSEGSVDLLLMDPGVWKCETCDKQYQTKRGLELHVGIHIAQRFECEHCKKTFTQKGSLLHHLTSQHSTSPRQFKCDSCPKEFFTVRNLRRHKRFHNEPVAESQCAVCGKVFKSLLHLQTHMKLHKSKLNFPCETCGKRFANRTKLSVHENSHTGARTFKCPHCSYAGRTPGPYYRHLKMHEKKEDAKISSPTNNIGSTMSVSTPSSSVQLTGTATQQDNSSPKPVLVVDTENMTLNFSSPVLEDLSNKSPQKAPQYHIVSVPRTPTTLVSISQNHSSPLLQSHSDYHSQNDQNQVSHAHHSSSHHLQNASLSYHSSSHQNWNVPNSTNSSKVYPSSTTTTFELVDFPCDQLPPPPSYQHVSYSNHAHGGNNYSSPSNQQMQNQQHAHTTAILHTSPSSAHSAVGASFISTTAASSGGSNVTIMTSGGGVHGQQQNEPMELSYKLHLDNGQDVPMELTKVFQRDPLELCVRQEFNPLMDLSSRVTLNGDGMNISSIPLNLNNNNTISCIGLGSYHKDLADRELCFNDLSGAFRQPIDLIARPDDPSHDICSEGSLVDLSLRSSFVQDQSTFLRELIDLSNRSESFHGELNLTNKHGGQPQQSHNHHHHHPSGKGGSTGGGQQSSQLTAVIYQDAMFGL